MNEAIKSKYSKTCRFAQLPYSAVIFDRLLEEFKNVVKRYNSDIFILLHYINEELLDMTHDKRNHIYKAIAFRECGVDSTKNIMCYGKASNNEEYLSFFTYEAVLDDDGNICETLTKVTPDECDKFIGEHFDYETFKEK